MVTAVFITTVPTVFAPFFPSRFFAFLLLVPLLLKKPGKSAVSILIRLVLRGSSWLLRCIGAGGLLVLRRHVCERVQFIGLGRLGGRRSSGWREVLVLARDDGSIGALNALSNVIAQFADSTVFL